ncbi:MAG TPA: CocE/NonD family hydrolase [Chloroflexia bacterium]|nr:CocE/NonD family hydrolase [Chloroflexia bacterium]
MNITGRLLDRILKLPPAETYDIIIRRNIKVPMPDGVTLLADHYAPREGPKRPTILVRSPYGRGPVFSATHAIPFAERGYQVLLQSCRGTAGSGGDFVYARNEHADGLATIEWIKQQDWYSGELAMLGESYLGFVQWAVAAYAGADLKALVPAITTSDFNHFRYQGGTITLESILGWSTMMTSLASKGLQLSSIGEMVKQRRLLDKAYNHLPLREADELVIGQQSPPFQSMMQYDPEDVYWHPTDFSHTLQDVTVPVNLIAGWYDLFLYWQLKDYQRLRAAGKQPYLLIGPWFHAQPSSLGPTLYETLNWLNAHVKGDYTGLRKNPVRLFVMGANQWRDFADWPPPATTERWYLQPGGGLAPTSPAESEPDHYRYNPVDPTPAVGGNSLGVYMGPKDNRELESRRDVLVYTSAPLEQDLEVIGPVTAELYVRSSLEYTDFFTRLCVVEPSGKSINLCDGIIRLQPGKGTSAPQADGSRCVRIELWPTAYRFRRGQRIRVQVSSGAHPRFPRNTGSGERIGFETTLRLADQTIYHDPAHPSVILLPVVN